MVIDFTTHDIADVRAEISNLGKYYVKECK